MQHYLLSKEKTLFAEAYKSFRKRMKDLGDFRVAFTESDGKALLLSAELLITSRLNMQDAEDEIREKTAQIQLKDDY